MFEGYVAKHEDHTRLHLTGSLIAAVEDNEATLQTTDFIYTLAVVMLFLGTLLVGMITRLTTRSSTALKRLPPPRSTAATDR